jgi:hypothetical protein
MWDRLKATTATPVGFDQHHHHHHLRQFSHSNQPGAGTIIDEQEREKTYWHDSFEQRLHALGVTDKPVRYEVWKGKLVAPREAHSIR